MLKRKDIAEDTPYDHPGLGRVTITFVDEADDVIYYRTEDAHMHKTDIDTFRRIADPLPQTVTLPTSTAEGQSPPGGDV